MWLAVVAVSTYWRVQDKVRLKRNLRRWESYYSEHPDGLMHVQGFDIYVPHSYHSFSMLDGVYEPRTTEIFKSLIRHDSLVVDAGANIGYFSLLAAKTAREVHSFEPTPESFALLAKSVEKNGFSNIRLHQLCLSDQIGAASFFLARSPLKNSLIPRDKDSPSITVECSTLDSFFPTERIDLLKIDVDGGEPRVLNGARRLIGEKRIRNVIVEWVPHLWGTRFEMTGFEPRLIPDTPVPNVLLSLS